MSTIKHLVPIIVFSFGMLASPVIAADDSAEWPCWQGPNHDGKSPDTGLLKEWPSGGPDWLWTTNGLGNGYSTVSVSGGLIYATGDVDDKLMLFAFDMNGKSRWKMPVDKAWTSSRSGRAQITVEALRMDSDDQPQLDFGD